MALGIILYIAIFLILQFSPSIFDVIFTSPHPYHFLTYFLLIIQQTT